MGAFDGWFGRRSDDPLQDLDPKVREFLEKESPVKLEKAQPAASQEDSSKPGPTQTEAAKPKATDEAAVPAQSQFQDGRYAHLWKTYRPLAEVENETKSDQERLADVLDSFKSRQSAIGAAALENCAEEQFDWSNCMRSGSLTARMTMCRDEVRKFEQCYNMQTRLLKVLGYLNAANKTPETDERIQLHADKLYHQWLEQDKAITEAQKEGKPAPKFKPIIPQQIVADATGTSDNAEMSDDAKKRLQEHLDTVDEREREAEKAALEAEMRAKKEMVEMVQGVWEENKTQREIRRKKGEDDLWDKMASAFRTPGSDGKKS